MLFIGLLMMSCDSGIDWTPYYTSDKTTPYGTYVLRKELIIFSKIQKSPM